MIGTPEYDEFVTCLNPQCVHVGATVDTGFGILGGGIGPYTYCSNCGTLLTKSQDLEELFDSHELKEGEAHEPTTDVPTGGQADNKPE